MASLSALLQEVLATAVGREIAGGSVLVLKEGRELAFAQAGFANFDTQTPFRRDTICRIYSMTKPITAAAAMLLLERGQLDLGQNVGDILPAFQAPQVWEQDKRVPARRNILIKDLLNMTSGLSYPGQDPAGREAANVFEQIDCRLYSDSPMTTQEVAEQLGQCALAFHSGERWMYGTSADILGAVIERVSGMPLGEFLQKEFFGPLEMTDTGFFVPAEKRHRLAEVYEIQENGLSRYVTNHLGIRYFQDGSPAFESGGAGLVSTIDDYGKFAAMLLGHGSWKGRQILSPETVRFLTAGKLLPWQQESLWRSWEGMAGYGYGNLMRVLEEPGMALHNGWKGEYGWDGWLGTYFCNSPANGVTVLLFCQRRDAGTLEVTRKLRNVIAANL